MALVIKKTVDLSSQGEEYKDIVLVFKSIPASQLPELYKKAEAVKGAEAIPMTIEVLENQFLSGTTPEGDITKEDIKDLDATAVNFCFKILSGQGDDPKLSSESTTTSTTEPDTVQK